MFTELEESARRSHAVPADQEPDTRCRGPMGARPRGPGTCPSRGRRDPRSGPPVCPSVTMPTARSTSGVVSGLRSVEKSTSPRLTERSASFCWAQPADDPAIGIATTMRQAHEQGLGLLGVVPEPKPQRDDDHVDDGNRQVGKQPHPDDPGLPQRSPDLLDPHPHPAQRSKKPSKQRRQRDGDPLPSELEPQIVGCAAIARDLAQSPPGRKPQMIKPSK